MDDRRLCGLVRHKPFDGIVTLDFRERTLNRTVILNGCLVNNIEDDFAARQKLHSFGEGLTLKILIDTDKVLASNVNGLFSYPKNGADRTHTGHNYIAHVESMQRFDESVFDTKARTLVTFDPLDATNTGKIRTFGRKATRRLVRGSGDGLVEKIVSH
jgi:hypothetical protein